MEGWGARSLRSRIQIPHSGPAPQSRVPGPGSTESSDRSSFQTIAERNGSAILRYTRPTTPHVCRGRRRGAGGDGHTGRPRARPRLWPEPGAHRAASDSGARSPTPLLERERRSDLESSNSGSHGHTLDDRDIGPESGNGDTGDRESRSTVLQRWIPFLERHERLNRINEAPTLKRFLRDVAAGGTQPKSSIS